jgi:hypothetical protein
MALFGFDLFSSIFKKNKKNESIKTLQEPSDDGSTVVEKIESGGVGGAVGLAVTYGARAGDEASLIRKYRAMSLNPECAEAIDDIITDMIVVDDGEEPVTLDLDRINKIGKSTKKKISQEFEEVLNLMKFRKTGFETAKSWYRDGRIYLQMIPHDNPKNGLKTIKHIDALSIKPIKEIKKKYDEKSGASIIDQIDEYFLFQPQDDRRKESGGKESGLRVEKHNIAYTHSGIYDVESKLVMSHLHKAIKPLNQLLMLEDSVVIYRISRAPERRIFYIDVGNLPRQKADQYLKDQMTRFKNKLVYNASTGEVKDDRKFATMTEDYWLPRREGKSGTEITTLPGGQNLGEIDDIQYMRKKMYKSLNIPLSRLEQERTFSLGRSGEIMRDELKFSRFIYRLRRRFSELFVQILGTQLKLKKIVSSDEWDGIKDQIEFIFANNSYISELKQNELLEARLRLASDADQFRGEFLSKEWMWKEIFKMDDISIQQMKKQIEKENSAGENDDAGQDDNDFGNPKKLPQTGTDEPDNDFSRSDQFANEPEDSDQEAEEEVNGFLQEQ